MVADHPENFSGTSVLSEHFARYRSLHLRDGNSLRTNRQPHAVIRRRECDRLHLYVASGLAFSDLGDRAGATGGPSDDTKSVGVLGRGEAERLLGALRWRLGQSAAQPQPAAMVVHARVWRRQSWGPGSVLEGMDPWRPGASRQQPSALGRGARSRRRDVGRPRLALMEIGRRFGGGSAPVVGRSLMLHEDVDAPPRQSNAFVRLGSWPQCP